MSVWDYVMPHRLLINKSLRKEAEGLRARIDAYQIEYDRRVEECQEEIKRVEAERQEKLLQIRDSLVEELQGERSFLESVAQDITSYADAYLYRNCLFQMRDIKRKQLEIFQEENDFLSSQMALIRRERDYLRERQNELTSFTDVKDIIRLTALSGYEIGFEKGDDAKALLVKVSNAISNCGPGQETERFALVRLKGIIQERSEYLPTIKYLAWVIQQKKQLHKQLSDKRSGVRDSQEDVRQEIEQIKKNISSLTEMLEEIAKRIRYYWAKPITYLNADICYAYIELNKLKERLRNDTPTLKRKRERLIKTIRSAKEDRKKWNQKRVYIINTFKKCDIRFRSDRQIGEKDETDIITTRLEEIQQIRKEGVTEAQTIYKQEYEEIIKLHEVKVSDYGGRRQKLHEEYHEAEAVCSKCEQRLILAKKQIESSKEADDRFILVKIFYKSAAVTAAKDELNKAQKALFYAQETKKSVKLMIDELEKESELEEKTFDMEVNNCKPRCLRPTATEQNEEKKLLLRREDMNQQHKEGGYENKN